KTGIIVYGRCSLSNTRGPRSKISNVPFILRQLKAFIVVRYSNFIAASSLTKALLVLVAFLNCLLKLSMALVVYINLLISGGYLNIVLSSFQLSRQLFTANRYFPDHLFSRLSSAFSASFSVADLYTGFRSLINS